MLLNDQKGSRIAARPVLAGLCADLDSALKEVG